MTTTVILDGRISLSMAVVLLCPGLSMIPGTQGPQGTELRIMVLRYS